MSTRKIKIANLIKKKARKTRKIQKQANIEKSINELKSNINKTTDQINNLEIRLRKKKLNKHLKDQLKNKQGTLLRKLKKLKSKLERETYKKHFIIASGTIESKAARNACVNGLKGEIHNNICYLQTPFKTDCAPHERLIKNNPKNIQTMNFNQFQAQKMKHDEKVTLCPIGKIFDKYGDDYEFVELVRNTRIADMKKPKFLNVLFRFSTPQTGNIYKFIYSSRNGRIPGLQTPITADKSSSWYKTENGPQFGQEAWRKNINQSQVSKSALNQKRYPHVKYERQIGGPYARFKEKDNNKWPNMPLWNNLQIQINQLAQKIFQKDEIINIPSATKPNDTSKDKKFLIKDYKITPIEWTGYLEKYEDIKNYFKNFPYKFIIITIKNTLYVVIDIKLKGKLMSKKESEDEVAKLNQKREKMRLKNVELENEISNAQRQVNEAGDNKRKRNIALKKLEVANEKKRQFQQKNRINQNLSNIHTGMTRSCDNHLEKIRSIVRDMTGYDVSSESDYNDYEKAKNNQLRVQYLSKQNNINQ